MDLAMTTDLQLTEMPAAPGHERLLHAQDRASGLNALISVHSTVRGPAAGGCRMFAYPTLQAAITDVERLSCGMTYKNAAADLPLGGGKAVILGAPEQIKSPDLMRAFGRFVNVLEGQYFTAEDVGISPQDLAFAAAESSSVVGLEGGAFASGDPSPFTAEGVFTSMQVTWAQLTGSSDLTGVEVALQGLGHVGMHLAERVHQAGGRLTVADLSAARLAEARRRFDARIVTPEAILSQKADILAPCAMGAVLNANSVPKLQVRAVVGAANNQLASDAIGQMLQDRAVLYAPDYVVNGGGIINVAMEILRTRDPKFRQSRLDGLGKTLASILDEAARSGDLPHRIANRMMVQRLDKGAG